jgi:hypothetical protein
MPASTDQVEMPGAAFVPVCVKVHGSSLPRKRWRTLIQSAIAKTVPSGFRSRLPLEGDETRRPIALTGILNLPVAGHSRHFGSSADYFRSSSGNGHRQSGRHVSKLPTSDIPARKRFERM